MAGAPARSYSFDRNDEQTLQPGHTQPQPFSQPYHDQRDVSPVEPSSTSFALPENLSPPPPPPAHRSPIVVMHPNSSYRQMQSQRQYGIAPNSPQNYSDYTPPVITPGADNLGEGAAGGGINGIAIGVANSNERESGAHALRDINSWGRSGDGNIAGPRTAPSERNQSGTPFADQYGYEPTTPSRPIHSQPSYGSSAPLAAGGLAPGMYSSSGSERSLPLESRSSMPSNAYPYQDSPYNRYSSSNLNLASHMGAINPNEADDDDDWGIGPQTTQQKRRSFIPFTSSRDASREGTPRPSGSATGIAATGATAGVAAGAAAGAGAGPIMPSRDVSGYYSAVPGGSSGSAPEIGNEKSEWLASQNNGNRRLKWIVGTLIVLAIIGGVLGGVLGSVLHKNKSGSGGSGSTPESVAADNKNELNIKSAEIQKLMNNKDLHKVFPGMDYTPLNAQYPECMHAPASQNNITRDMAVMSQLTNAVRLYGTDCNQTEMVLEAIKRLELSDMKVWLGVWLGNNDTTNTRQIEQMWTVLDDYGSSKIKGIIVGNEVLYRKDLTEAQLVGNITAIKKKLDEKKITLPIATSDLGDNWSPSMATQVDIVMSNVHPFFAGVDATQAAGWTWSFWTDKDVVLTKGNANTKQIIAEVGWPSAGGKSCGGAASCTSGSVAGTNEMNTFMQDWVCQSMTNGTEYFWFEAFDEPWKIRYNEKGKEWEDKWGLLDVNRNLKDGVKIPDCGGKTVS